MHKNTIALTMAGLLTTSLLPSQAFAWGCSRSFSGSGRYGGSFSHSGSTSGGWGNFSHSGSSSYTSRSGQTYSGSHSGSGSYGYGGASYSGSYSTAHGGSGSYSGSASYHGGGSYYGYHGCAYPTTYSCSTGGAFAAGMVTGAVVGAAVASAAKPPPPAPVYVYPAPGVYVAPPPVVITTPTTTTTTTTTVVQTSLPIGSTTTVLPPGFVSLNVNGTEYYQKGPTWYQMKVGGNGVYFVVVPAP